MTTRVLSACVALVLLCHWTMGDDVTTSSANDVNGTTEEPGFRLRMQIAERGTSSLTVSWEIPNEEVLGYKVRCQKEDSEDAIYSPPLNKTETEYLMDNLMTDAEYTVCVRPAFPADNPAGSSGVNGLKYSKDEQECADTATIPVMRRDSIIALCVSIGYILLMILIGYICYQCAKKRLMRGDEEDDEGEGEPQEEKIAPVPYRPAYVAPPSGAEPVRSSIEDPDIPYITPPVDQLSKNERMRYDAKV